MILSDLSVKRPVLATVVNALLVAFGLFALSQLPLRETPDIDPPIVSIDTSYRGAAAEIVENKVTRVIEDEISGIAGVRSIESISSDGRSRITVEFNLERDIDAAANDIRDRVSRVLERLPEEADPPDIAKADADAQPIMWLTLSSETMASLELYDYLERQLVDRLSAVDGVSRVRIGGYRRYAMRIWLDRRAMAARGIAVADVERALRQENVELPAGQLESAQRDFTVRTARQYRTPEDFRNLVIARGDDGYLVRLRDIARVELGAENEKRLFRANGVPAAGLGIIKQSQANTLSVANAVKAEVARILPTLPEGTRLAVNTDYSVFIQSSLNEVTRTLLITALLVIFIIYLFLGEVRPTLIPALTVPISLIGSFILVAALGFSINILTLLALVLAIGLVVDDSIVVLENIYRRIEHGEPPLLAAYRGSRQVGFAVVATTLVLIAVMLPIALVPGNVGRLFTEFALALAAAVAVSSIVALTLAPVLAARLLRKTHAHARPLRNAIQRGNRRLAAGYRQALEWALAHPKAVVAACAAVMAGIVLLLFRVPAEFAPREDRGGFFVFLTAPEGASFDYTAARVAEAEEVLMGFNERGLSRRILAIAPAGGDSTANTAFMVVTMADWRDRDVSTQDLLLDAYRQLQAKPGAHAVTVPRPGLGQGRARGALQVAIGGNSYEELAVMRDRLKARLAQNPNIFGVDSDYKENNLQMRVDIDRDRAAALGVSVETIGHSLESLLGGRQVTSYVDRGEEYDVILQAQGPDRATPHD
ncbi:MAG: efflux RND transporter permease subunit, partial [Alphaproteobacteria bacterium]